MAERMVTDCDRCGVTHGECQRLELHVGSEFDGVETVGDWRRLDLCPKCCGVLLGALIRPMSDGDRAGVLRRIADHRALVKKGGK